MKYIFIVIFSLLLSCSNNQTMADLQLSLEATKSQYAIKDQIPLTLTLKNTGKEVCWVNARLGVGYPDTDEREVYLLISKTDSNSEYDGYLDYQVDYRPKPPECAALEKEQSLSRSLDLNFWYKMTEAGTYSIRAVYHAAADEDCPDLVQEKIESNAIELTLLP